MYNEIAEILGSCLTIPGYRLVQELIISSLLAGKGYLVFGHDHVGHGESEGKRAYIGTDQREIQSYN